MEERHPMACSPAQRKIDLAKYEVEMREFYVKFGMSSEMIERAIDMAKKSLAKT